MTAYTAWLTAHKHQLQPKRVSFSYKEKHVQVFLIFLGALITVSLCLACGTVISKRTALPVPIRLTAGTPVASLLIFAALTCHAGFLPVYVTGAAILVAIAIRSPMFRVRPLPAMPWFFRIVFACYGLMYLICALAPEIQPDAASYHLRLVSEYVRLHAFSNRVAFFDAMPQGMEMLFVPAFAIGGASAAKLVHYIFLVSAAASIRHVSMELGYKDTTGCAAAALFFCAPVCSVAGTSAYTDAGLASCCVSILYLLIRWQRERSASLLLTAALIAGCCYSVKQTFGWVAVACGIFVWSRSRRLRPAVAFAAAALAAAIPWILRGWILFRNPFAPFLNSWFPNQVSTVAVESELAANFSAFRGDFPWNTALFDYTVAGGHEGLLGPAFLAAPLALLALRRKQGRWLLVSCAVFAAPFLANTGTRFLMPALAPAALALASVFPAPAAVALTVVQAVGCVPAVMDFYEKRKEWRLREIPVRAALRLEPETRFLDRSIKDFGVVRFIADGTPSGSRIFSLVPLPEFYVPREVLVYWQSALGQRRADALVFARAARGTPAEIVSCVWQPHDFQTLRVTADSGLTILEAGFNKGGPVSNSWRALRGGDSLTLSPDLRADSTVVDLLLWPANTSPRILARSASRGWLNLGPEARVSRRTIDVRRDATAALRRAGYEYILGRAADEGAAGDGASGDGYVPLTMEILRHPSDWGLEPVGPYRDYWLFRVLPPAP